MMDIVRITPLLCFLVILQGCHGIPRQQERQAFDSGLCIDYNSLAMCLMPLQVNYGSYLTSFVGTFHFADQNRRQAFCRQEKETAACIRGAPGSSSCEHERQYYLRGLLAAGDLICSDHGGQLLQDMSNSKCAGESGRSFNYSVEGWCASLAEPNWPALGPDDMEQICPAMVSQYKDCVVETMTESCGEEVGQYVEELVTAFTEHYPIFGHCIGST